MKNFKLPSNIPHEKYPPPEVFIHEALDCVEKSRNEGITLRIMGGMAIYLHSKEYEQLFNSLSRLEGKVFTDIDLMSYKNLQQKILDFFEKRGYTYDRIFIAIYGKNRCIFYGGVVPMVEVFFDRLEMCHTIDLKGRLEVDYPTIPLADLLLEKLQIVQINEKDIKDVILLLRAHELGEHDKNVINVKYISDILSKDWGFYYTVTTNLNKIKSRLPLYAALNEKDREDVSSKINKLLSEIDRTEKTVAWKLRAKIGPRKKWYNDVEEIIR
jgi:hypothetical protein